MKPNIKHVIILLILSYMFLMFGNGVLSLTNPDEVFYTQTAKEMVQQKSWMTPYLFGQPQFEKPIFLYWAMRLSFLVFGFNSFAARFAPALFGIIGVLAVYFLSLIGLRSQKKAFLASLCLTSSGLYIGLSRTVFTDLIFSVFIILSLAAFFWGYSQKNKKAQGVLWFFIFSALAVLTKGPLGLLMCFGTIFLFLAWRRELKYLLCPAFFWGLGIFCLIALPWYILMIKLYGHSFTHEFFYNDHIRRILEAEHISNDRWYFYPLSMVGCMFPWSIFVFAGLVNLFFRLKKEKQPFFLFLACWVTAVFLTFQFAHSKLTSYIFPVFPALAILAGNYIYENASRAKPTRAFIYLSLVNAIVMLIFPIGMFFVLQRFLGYFSSLVPFWFLLPVLLILLLAALFFTLKRKFITSAYLYVFLLPLCIYTAVFLRRDVEVFLSTKDACDYLVKNYEVKNKILCSKGFVRGVKFYTDKEVVALDLPGSDFFSPHPLEFIKTDKEFMEFLRRQPVAFGVLKKGHVGFMREERRLKVSCTVLKSFGSAYVVKIEALGE
ncbi:MAG: glycosyltransferase family 39 protein [Candidatus Omnitrophota bacterium]